MKKINLLLSVLLFSFYTHAQNYSNEDFKIKKVSVKHEAAIAVSIWEITVKGTAGKTTPTPAGQLNGAPVLGYVFPTSLEPTDVGFGKTEGIVALALTSHPDFDDTPLWDENADRNYENDGIIWHPHWVILTEDKRVEGGLSVKEFDQGDASIVLPPTNPGMPMYMDSPGFQVIAKGNSIKVVVPDYRMNNQTNFSYDGVTAYMQVNTENKKKPMLGVYKVYSVASGDLSLPYKAK
ncbi:hypothetical protein LB465_06585 [Salegentibacter sp. LM13S]|uniref:hypothetical protein n=1 Tax=Salegentibacter lacus TaxID=2873599 RepID=UPI001CCB3802|nr:hypothetical protein [Salegentibacter lacus]MBZ9630443.1 hypothetical protein [Salegentibacter lacus]